MVAYCTLFAIQQKYDFSSKSQQGRTHCSRGQRCLQYSKSTIFQANHNGCGRERHSVCVVCNTAKVRFFKQITTKVVGKSIAEGLFAIQQKYDFSSKSQLGHASTSPTASCLQYSKSTIFQANHNSFFVWMILYIVVCNTAKVRFFKQITTGQQTLTEEQKLFAIQQKYDFSSKSQLPWPSSRRR